MSTAPLQFLLLVFAGWVIRRQLKSWSTSWRRIAFCASSWAAGALRFTEAQRRGLATKGQALGRRALERLTGVVTPDTILRWYRELIARKYCGTTGRGCGRSGTAASLQRLVVQFATENPTWRYTWHRGALRNLGHELGDIGVARDAQRSSSSKLVWCKTPTNTVERC